MRTCNHLEEADGQPCGDPVSGNYDHCPSHPTLRDRDHRAMEILRLNRDWDLIGNAYGKGKRWSVGMAGDGYSMMWAPPADDPATAIMNASAYWKWTKKPVA